MPSEYWDTLNIKGDITPSQVIGLAEKWKVHRAVIAGRIRHEKSNHKILSKLLGYHEILKQFLQSPLN